MSEPSPFEASPEALPARADVVIIGGGVAGVGAALALAERGVSVLLCEKGRVAAEQSSRNWGWIRRQGRDPRELPLMTESMALWRRYAGALDTDIGFRQTGCTYLCTTPAEAAEREAWLVHARDHDIPSRMLSRAEISGLLDTRDSGMHGAISTPDDCLAEPSLAVPALARHAQSLGATIFEGTAVRTLMRIGGRVSGVMTEHGPVACDAVILAGGAWSRPFLENAGIALPQLAVRSSALRTGPARANAAPPAGMIGAGGASIRPRRDGGYTVGRAGAARLDLVPAAFRHLFAFLPMLQKRWRIVDLGLGRSFFGPLGHHRWREDEVTPFEQMRILDPAPDARLLTDVWQKAQALYPQLSGAEKVQGWAGMIDVTPDEVPIIDGVPGLPGLVVATGLSGHGFGLGLGAGRLAAELATGEAPCVTPDPYRMNRFAASRKRAA
ncbi:NAD(P)/FAD-dependent oxidoreductase [Roseovarius sp. D22-M7]|uniref:NAD(P)/FAD-dependent oxidoreductase n=1 Tax=Roseovarius sp. D22-M7 TaxID=3127116 RepID=UPI00300FB0F7